MSLIPPDVRQARDFRIIKGTDDGIIRTDYEIDAAVLTVELGEYVVLNSSNKVTKVSGQALATPAQNVACSWTLYAKNNTYTGQSDAVATGQLTCISGPFQAQTKMFESTGTFTPGFLLVVRESSTVTGLGVLDAVDGDTASAKQIAASVGRVIGLSGGILTYRSNGAA